ncbi:MAG TPA: glycosyltransferase 87 family protein [Candidatus Limnocylindrales bacterium]
MCAITDVLGMGMAGATWAGASVTALLVAMRAIGIAPLWLPAFLLWRPAFDGLWAGNVAPFMFALFAIGPWFGAALPLSASFKLYNGIAALWLVRTRRWRAIATAAAIVATIVLVTLPLTGIDLWSEWLAGLGYYQQSQTAVPGLYGMSLASWFPAAVVLVLGVGVIAFALVPAGREGLARLGLATIVASPSLFTPGFLWAVPAMAMASLTIALASFVVMAGPAQWLAWWIPIGVMLVAWVAPGMRRTADAGLVSLEDPFADHSSPWPTAPHTGSPLHARGSP